MELAVSYPEADRPIYEEHETNHEINDGQEPLDPIWKINQ